MRTLIGRGVELYVAAFGKHPGWNDFMDDLGIETPQLADFRQLIIEKGIKACVEGGRWTKLESDQALETYAVAFLYRGGGDVIVGRMWSSKDGKGRPYYPMVVCVQTRSVSVDDALTMVLPALAAAQEQCQAADSAEQVNKVVQQLRESLRTRAATLETARTDLRVGGEVAGELAEQPALRVSGAGAGRQGFHRVMYQMERELAPFLRGQTSTRSRGVDPVSRQMRVPACWSDSTSVLSRWISFLFLRIEPWCPVMLLHPVGGDWLDIAVGEISGPELFCIRASTKLIPLASEIPYTIDAADAAKFDRFLADAASMPAESLRAPAPAVNAASAARDAISGGHYGMGGRKVLILALVLGLLLLGSLGWLVFGPRGQAKPAGEPAPAGTPGGSTRAEPRVEPAPITAPVRQEVAALPPATPAAESTAASWDPAAWERLCTAYWDWLALWLRRLDEPPPKALFGDRFASRRELYAQHAELGAAVAALDRVGRRGDSGANSGKGGGLDPWSIAGLEPDRDLAAIARNAPASARSAAAARATAEGIRIIDEVESKLNGPWSEPGGLVAVAGRMREFGWESAAAFLTAVGESARPGPGRDLAVGIDGVLAVRDVVTSMDRRWGRIEKTIVSIDADAAARSDRVIGRFGDWARQACRRPGPAQSPSAGAALTVAAIVAGLAELKSIDAQITRPSELAEAIGVFLERQWAETDRVQFAADGPVYRRVAAAGDSGADASVFRDWLYQAGQFRSLDVALDPRRAWKPTEVAARIDAALKAIAEPQLSTSAGSAAGELVRDAKAMAERVQALLALPWNRQHEAEITAQSRVLASEQDALALRAERAVQDARAELGATAAASRDDLKAREQIVAGAPGGAINAFWRDQRDRLLATYDTARFKEMMAHARRIEEALVRLDKSAPPAAAPADAAIGRWSAALGEELARRRDRRFEQAFAGFRGSLIEPDDEAVKRAFSEAAADVAAVGAKLRDFASATARVEAMLNAGEPPGQTGAAWVADPLMSDKAVRESVAPVRSRVDALAEIDRETETAALLSRVNPPPGGAGPIQPAPEVVVAVWHRLGNRTGVLWPSTAEDIAAEGRLIELVRRIAAAATDPARAQALRDEIAAEGPRRLKRMLGGAERDDQFEAAVRAMPEFGLKPDELEPRIRFNLLLAEFKKSLAESGARGDDGAAAAARSFVEHARSLPGGTPFLGDAAAAIQAVETTLAGQSSGPPPVDPTTLGPGSTGKYTGKADGARLAFTPAGGGAPLEFVRVEGDPAAHVQPFYLGATEVSLAMFLSITKSADSGGRLAGLLPASDPTDDPRLGPRTWEWEAGSGGGGAGRGGIQPSRQWLSAASANAADQYGPGTSPGRPGPDHPMQYLTPQAAMAAASLAGCRLPTPAEWRAADAAFGARVDPAVCNLRDQTWARHNAYVTRAIGQGKNIQPAMAGSFASAAGQTSPSDDGILWFAPVTAGGGEPLRHLRGNVAEWLLDVPPAEVPATATSAAADDFLRTHADSIFVGGGSGMSDSSAQGVAPQPVKLADASEGYADVGFRLAFSATGTSPARLPLAERLERALTPTPYLRGR